MTRIYWIALAAFFVAAFGHYLIMGDIPMRGGTPIFR